MKNANEKFAKINESNNSKQKCNNSNNNVANNNNNSEGSKKKNIFKLSEIEGESVMLRCLHNS